MKRLLKQMTAADLSRKSGVHPSYISRALKEPHEAGHKAIGEVTARKLEAGARKPEGWLDMTDVPTQHEPSASERVVSESDWALLEDIKTVLDQDDLAKIRARAAYAKQRAMQALLDARADDNIAPLPQRPQPEGRRRIPSPYSVHNHPGRRVTDKKGSE